MAAETRETKSFSNTRRPWDGNIRDVVSLLVYCQEKGGEEMRILACEDQGIIFLPRKEITARDTIQDHTGEGGGSSGVTSGTGSSGTGTTTTASSPLLIWVGTSERHWERRLSVVLIVFLSIERSCRTNLHR